MTNLSTGPLVGLRVIELDAIGPVPFAAMLLADLGCDVLRITRPPYPGAAWEDVGGTILHRGRHSLTLNLKSEAGRADLLSLIEGADSLIEGYRPGVMERMGLGPTECLARNPRLVYGRMTGWGQTGPLAPRAGHDINYIAVAGMLHAIGGAGQPPTVPLNVIGDYGGGAMFLVTGLLAGLLSAGRTGKGQVVDAAMTDGTVLLTSLFQAFLHTGQWQDRRGANLLDGFAPFYRCYECADGRHVAVGALEPPFFAQLLAGLGLPTGRFVQYDQAGWPAMGQAFAEIFRTRSRDVWAAHFAQGDACVSPVLSMAEARDHPHNRARDTFTTLGGVPQPGTAPRFSVTPGSVRPAAGVLDLASALARWALPADR
ncbi:CaiB/BaiF CoA transferase family protein [Niveispirillum sp. KHB5.9]|uniref:CaiB/BaiF CoA transferase family protein n=1 Tax=Niveispirillum sp. KHB5.9 TaxID=3400269 RepID=UPI003A847404